MSSRSSFARFRTKLADDVTVAINRDGVQINFNVAGRPFNGTFRDPLRCDEPTALNFLEPIDDCARRRGIKPIEAYAFLRAFYGMCPNFDPARARRGVGRFIALGLAYRKRFAEHT